MYRGKFGGTVRVWECVHGTKRNGEQTVAREEKSPVRVYTCVSKFACRSMFVPVFVLARARSLACGCKFVYYTRELGRRSRDSTCLCVSVPPGSISRIRRPPTYTYTRKLCVRESLPLCASPYLYTRTYTRDCSESMRAAHIHTHTHLSGR